jgi:hypothetical protein
MHGFRMILRINFRNSINQSIFVIGTRFLFEVKTECLDLYVSSELSVINFSAVCMNIMQVEMCTPIQNNIFQMYLLFSTPH